MLAAEVDGQVAGWVHVYVDQTLYGPLIAQIGGLAVDQAWSRQGVGAGLMEAAERWAGDAGCHAVWIRSGEQRTSAYEFYRACGHEPLKKQIDLVETLVEDVHDPRVACVDVPSLDANTR